MTGEERAKGGEEKEEVVERTRGGSRVRRVEAQWLVREGWREGEWLQSFYVIFALMLSIRWAQRELDASGKERRSQNEAAEPLRSLNEDSVVRLGGRVCGQTQNWEGEGGRCVCKRELTWEVGYMCWDFRVYLEQSWRERLPC